MPSRIRIALDADGTMVTGGHAVSKWIYNSLAAIKKEQPKKVVESSLSYICGAMAELKARYTVRELGYRVFVWREPRGVSGRNSGYIQFLRQNGVERADKKKPVPQQIAVRQGRARRLVPPMDALRAAQPWGETAPLDRLERLVRQQQQQPAIATELMGQVGQQTFPIGGANTVTVRDTTPPADDRQIQFRRRWEQFLPLNGRTEE